MAKDLQAIGRQTNDLSMQLPTSNAFASIQNVYSDIAKVGAFAAEKVAVENARRQGVLDASNTTGTKKQLSQAFGLASASYNQAFQATEASIVTAKANNVLTQALSEMTRPGKLNPTTPEEWGVASGKIIDGAVMSATEGNEPVIRNALALQQSRLSLRAFDATEKHNISMAKAQFNEVATNATENYKDAVFSGEPLFAQEAENDYRAAVNNQVTLGVLNEFEAREAIKSFEDGKVVTLASEAYLMARANGTGDEVLADLAEKKPDDLSVSQWRLVGSELLKLKSQEDAKLSGQLAQNYGKWVNVIASQKESVTLASIEDAKDQVSATQYLQLQNKVITAQNSMSSESQKVSNFYRLSQGNPAEANSMTSDTKNKAYNIALNQIVVQKRQDNPNYVATMDDRREAALVFGVPIPEFNNSMSFRLTSGNAVEAVEAARQYRLLTGNPDQPYSINPVLNLDQKSQAAAVAINFAMDNGGLDPERAVEMARASVNASDSAIIDQRIKTLKSTLTTKEAKNQFKNDVGVSSDKTPQAYERWHRLYSMNAASFNTLEEARIMTNQQFSSRTSDSRYAPPGQRLMDFAPEKVIPYVQNGAWFDNQFTIAVQQVARNYNGAVSTGALPADAMESIDINGPAFPTSASELDIYSRSRIIPKGENQSVRMVDGKPTLKIGGKERVIYFDADDVTFNQESGRISYPIYYNDDLGLRRNLTNVRTTKDGQTVIGPARFDVIPLDEYLPEIYNQLNDKRINDLALDVVDALFEQSNPNTEIIDPISTLRGFGQAERRAKKIEFVRENLDAAKDIVKRGME